VAHPEMVLGEHSLKGTMYGRRVERKRGGEKETEYALVPKKGTSLESLLTEAIKNLPRTSPASPRSGSRPRLKSLPKKGRSRASCSSMRKGRGRS